MEILSLILLVVITIAIFGASRYREPAMSGGKPCDMLERDAIDAAFQKEFGNMFAVFVGALATSVDALELNVVTPEMQRAKNRFDNDVRLARLAYAAALETLEKQACKFDHDTNERSEKP